MREVARAATQTLTAAYPARTQDAFGGTPW